MKMEYITRKMRELVGGYAFSDYPSLLPCNTIRLKVNPALSSEKQIKDYIRYARDYRPHGQVLFPVTERDTHHKLWLDVCKKDENAQIVETSSNHHGHYRCWLIFYQCNRKEGT